MPAIRSMGFDDQGNFTVEPNWGPQGVKVGLHADEIATMESTGQPISTALFLLQNALPFVESPVIKDPTKAANAKAQTLQSRLDGLFSADGKAFVGQCVVSVDKDTQQITVSDA